MAVKLINNLFWEKHYPCEEIFNTSIQVDHKPVKIQLFDTKGTVQGMNSEFFTSATRNGDGFIFVCAVNDLKSLERLNEFIGTITTIRDSSNYPLLSLINKVDLKEKEHAVTTALCNTNVRNYSIMFTSSKTGENIREAFETMIHMTRVGKPSIINILKDILRRDSKLVDKYQCSIL